MSEFEGQIDLQVKGVSMKVSYDLSTEQPVLRRIDCSCCSRKATTTDLVQITQMNLGSIMIHQDLAFAKVVVRAAKRALKHRVPWCRRCYLAQHKTSSGHHDD